MKNNDCRAIQNRKDNGHDGCSLRNVSHCGEVQPALPHLHLLPLALVLICNLPLLLLVSGAILGIVSSVATGETSVAISLAVLLLLLVVVPLSWGLSAVGCLLLLWPNYPSPWLLLRSSTLSVGHDPEALRLCGWSCHRRLPLLLCLVSRDAILL
jgi:hypothetical protein